tara:strand:- start:16431 stop:16700 length:270 start_codon:yes stop_codon:yes gene_type:complete
MKCPISNRDDLIDDCHITIEFGYGSDRDCTTYTFSPVHDEVGKKILKYISSLAEDGFDVEDYAKDVMNDIFGVDQDWSDEDKRDHGLLD